MFAEKFSPLISKYPQDADALHRVAEYFRALEKKGKFDFRKVKLDPSRLFEIAQVGNKKRLERIICLLVSEHIFRRVLIVESQAGGGIQTFDSYRDVPETIHDTRLDIQIEVTIDNLKTFYQVACQ